jgi:hypothetical protein
MSASPTKEETAFILELFPSKFHHLFVYSLRGERYCPKAAFAISIALSYCLRAALFNQILSGMNCNWALDFPWGTPERIL